MSSVKPRVRVPKSSEVGEIIEIKTLIRHPMHSGHVIDSNGNTIPRQIITSFEVKFNGETVFTVELKPSVSANPYFTFPFKVTEAGTFDFIWTEDTGEVFTLSKQLNVE